MPSLPALLDLWRSPFPTGNDDYTPEKLMKAVRDIMHTDLSQHENSAATGTMGGHTLSRHVGKSTEDLIALLAAAPEATEISCFYHNQNFSETVIAKAILDNLHRVYNWYYRIADPAGVPLGTGGGNKKFLHFKSESTFPVGFGYRKVMNLADDTYIYERLISSHVFVKLKRGSINGRDKFIVTAFPCHLVPEAL